MPIKVVSGDACLGPNCPNIPPSDTSGDGTGTGATGPQGPPGSSGPAGPGGPAGPPGPPGSELWINIDDFGASRNPAVDSTAAIQAALDAASGGSVDTTWVLVPNVDLIAGEGYGVYGTVTIPPNVVLFGIDGADGNASLIYSFAAAGVAVFQFAAGINRSGIEGLQIIGPSGAPSGRAVSMVASQFNYAKNLQIWYHEIGIDLSDGVTPFSAYNLIEQCEINVSTSFGIRSYQQSNANTIVGVRIFFTRNVGNTAVALGIGSARAISISGLALEDYNVGLQIGGAPAISMTGCYFEKGATLPLGADFDVLADFEESPVFEGSVLFEGNHHADPWPLATGFIDATQYGVLPDGTDKSVQLQHALDDAFATRKLLRLPAGTIVIGTTLLYRTGVTMEGAGPQQTVLDFTGTGYCLAQATPGVRIFDVSFRSFEVDFSALGDGGIDLADVSTSVIQNITVRGPGSAGNGYRVAGALSGFAVYNLFFNCRVFFCDHGYSIQALGSNDTHLHDCRVGACVRGVSIVDSNHVVVSSCAIEGNTTGVYVEATSSSISDNATVALTRFEGNTAANIEFGGVAANVRLPKLLDNAHVTGTPVVGVPDRLTMIGDQGVVRSAAGIEDAPFSFIRTVQGAANPAMRVRDDATSAGTPTTLQISTGRVLGHAISVALWNGAVDVENFFVTAAGAVTGVSLALSAGWTAVSGTLTGNLTLSGPASTLFFGDGTTAGNRGYLVQPASGNNITYATWRVGTLSSGNKWAEQFSTVFNRTGLISDASGNLLAINPYQFRYNATNGRAGIAVCRFWADLATALVNGNITLSAGFGAGATAVVDATSRDMRGEVIITVGAAPSADPTVTLTFTNGAWNAAPFCIPQLVGGTGFIAGTVTRVTQTRSTTTIVWAFIGTPIAAETYVLAWQLLG